MPEPKEIGHQVRFPNTWIGLFKRGWWEIPEVMGASVMAIIGMGMAFYGCMKYCQKDGDRREYKTIYTIVRPDDPKACSFRNPVFSSYGKSSDGEPKNKKY